LTAKTESVIIFCWFLTTFVVHSNGKLPFLKNITILGSTGSIGTQTLQVIDQLKPAFNVYALTAYKNADLLIKQALAYQPEMVVIVDESKYKKVKTALPKIKVISGKEGLIEAAIADKVDVVLTALVGFAGLEPTIAAIKKNKNIALANKETLVVAGEIITALVKQNKVQLLPVDSEHSAIFQCLEADNDIEKIYLTASGGPFRGKQKTELEGVTRAQALKHPNWSMGAKITIDSATMMNKGLEVIEAKWLFGLKNNQVDVIVHPQSIIHSIVQFKDGSMKAQMGLPDMKLPIQYALTHPKRIANKFERFSFLNYSNLTFEQPDKNTFKCLQLAYDAMNKCGNVPCILNAANEVAVASFLADKINFLDIADLVKKCMSKINHINNPSLDDLFETDAETRKLAATLV